VPLGLGGSCWLPILNAMPSDEAPPSSSPSPTVPIVVSEAVHVGVLVAPRLPTGVRSEIETGLQAALLELVGDVAWKVTVLSQSVTAGPSESVDVMDAARQVLLERDWDLVLVVTDLPLTEGRRTVVSTCSPVHGVGVVSFPAIGSVHTRARTTKLLAQVAMTLVGTDDRDSLRQLAGDTPEGEGESAVRYAARVIGGNVGLLVAMVRANRPWRLAIGLSRALSVAGATAILTLVTTDLWLLADAYGIARFALLGLGSVLAVTLTLVLGAGLWERPRTRRQRRQVSLFNAATLATVVLGVGALFLALLVVSWLGALLLIDSSVLRQVLGHQPGATAYVRIAWVTACLATTGGALGAGLETDAAVRAAAYTTSDAPDTDTAEGNSLPR
jgi:hypothetical protein